MEMSIPFSDSLILMFSWEEERVQGQVGTVNPGGDTSQWGSMRREVVGEVDPQHANVPFRSNLPPSRPPVRPGL